MSDLSMCSQCREKPTVTMVNKAPLCVNCYSKLTLAQAAIVNAHTAEQNARYDEWVANATMANMALDDIENVTGMRGLYKRTPIPQRPSTTTVNSSRTHTINIDRSTVGAINTGQANEINVGLNSLEDAGRRDMATALKMLTEQIAREQALDEAGRQQLLERLAFLMSQAAVPMKDRKHGMIRDAIEGITEGAKAITSVAAAWSTIMPPLLTYLGS